MVALDSASRMTSTVKVVKTDIAKWVGVVVL
jgi:hypothetical protein